VETLARAADETLMQPLRAAIGNATHLLISPDGPLNLMPFEVLRDERGRYAVERYAISYLTSGRDLLRMQVPRMSRSGPVVVADPAFGDAAAAAASPRIRAATTEARRSVTSADDFTAVYFAPLAGTAREARTIGALFPDARLLTQSNATKRALTEVTAPSILHIATHAFFIRAAAATGATTAGLENPLLRSGLALSGANRRADGARDGILTALEAANLNLWGTKLVALSACDTGVGEVRDGEGVYGLRRAFVLAGAETLVMSLWPVSDTVTRELMSGYYRRLRSGLGRGEALRATELAMLARSDRRHPFYWASFIQAGEWANLEGRR
jgi:CHAT domain-containing protein